MKYGKILAVSSLLTTMLISGTALGDGFSSEQVRLNNEAAQAVRDKNYVKAEQLFKANLLLGEFDLTYLNLGRVYALQNKCVEALDAYDKVTTAPAVGLISNEELKQKMSTYRSELTEQCTGNVVLRCKPKDMLVSVDGGDFTPCSTNPFPLQPKTHRFVGKIENKKVEVEKNITSMDVNYVDLEILTSVRQVELAADRNKRLRTVRNVGWGLLGGGIALAGAGGGMLGYSLKANKDLHTLMHNSRAKQGTLTPQEQKRWNDGYKKHRILRNTGGVLLGVGGACVVAGITMVIYSYSQASDSDTEVASYTLMPQMAFTDSSFSMGMKFDF